jgi:predicted TIM-barrel fold metal-dependent hydrolase
MPTVIDVDAHFEPGKDWLKPYPKLAAKLPEPDLIQIVIDTICGDLLRELPAERRPSRAELEPPGLLALFAEEKAQEATRRGAIENQSMIHAANASTRVKWMDAQGIDIQNVICSATPPYLVVAADIALRHEVVRTSNDWLADSCDQSKGRLLPVTMLEFTDLDWVAEELERMRARGSRTFLIPGYPVGGKTPAHPDWDKVWATACDLGMVPMLHTGFEHMRFDRGWAEVGGDATLLRQFGVGFTHVSPMMLIRAMIFGGVFERFPNLTLVLAELGVGWLPFLFHQIDDPTAGLSQLYLGKWKYPLKPSEYLARNVRGTPLNGGKDRPLLRIMEDLPEDMIVFSSDFPHFEGFADPKAHYDTLLKDMTPARRDRFMGGSMADVFQRMGDPVC